jgi:hypothetical protein
LEYKKFERLGTILWKMSSHSQVIYPDRPEIPSKDLTNVSGSSKLLAAGCWLLAARQMKAFKPQDGQILTLALPDYSHKDATGTNSAASCSLWQTRSYELINQNDDKIEVYRILKHSDFTNYDAHVFTRVRRGIRKQGCSITWCILALFDSHAVKTHNALFAILTFRINFQPRENFEVVAIPAQLTSFCA